MTLLPAWTLALYGIGIVLAFGAWKLSVTPRLLARKASAATS